MFPLADSGQHASLMLSRVGLAEERTSGHGSLDRELEPTLRRLGERGDIIRTLGRELHDAGIHRSAQAHAICDPAQGNVG